MTEPAPQSSVFYYDRTSKHTFAQLLLALLNRHDVRDAEAQREALLSEMEFIGAFKRSS